MPYTPEELQAYKELKASKQASPSYTPEELQAYKELKASRGSAQEPKDPSLFQRFKSGFMEKPIDQPEGFEKGDVAEFAGKAGLETVGGMLGTPFGPAGVGVGAAAGKATHEAIRRGIGAFNPGSTDMGSDMGVVGKVVGEGALQAAGAKYLPPITKAAGSAIGATARLGGRLIQPVVRGISGVSKQAMDTMIDSPSKVLSYIGTTAEEISTHAKAFSSAIEQNASRAGEAYRNIVNGIVRTNDKYGPNFKIDLASDLSNVVNEVKRDFGYGLKGRVADETESNIFSKFAKRAGELNNATLDEAYFFQKDLTHAIKQNMGKPISAALGQLKSTTMSKLSSTVPEIAEANKIYAHAMELSDELSRVTNADNSVTVIRNAFKNKTKSMDTMLKLAQESADARKSLEGVLYGSSGAEFTPGIRELPPTGFTAGIGAGGATAIFNPATIPYMIPAAAMLSPRLVGYGTAGVSGAGNMIRKGLGSETAANIGGYSTPAIMANKAELLRKKYQERR